MMKPKEAIYTIESSSKKSRMPMFKIPLFKYISRLISIMAFSIENLAIFIDNFSTKWLFFYRNVLSLQS